MAVTTAAIVQEKPALVVPHTLLATLPPPPPPPLPPAAAEVAVDEKKPIPTLALIEPEPEIPIKRYYGRRRGDESSSDEASTSGEDTNGDDRKPTIVPALQVTEPTRADDTGSTGSVIKSSFDTVQIKQEKLDPIEQSGAVPTGGSSGSTSLRFGKTVPGGTSAPEFKVGMGASTTTAGSGLSSKSVNPRDRLKRKMQILLNKQCESVSRAARFEAFKRRLSLAPAQ
uniref:Uncharacterized protein n=1 Tax=Anopheles culicifacies TaxID=139723 RepID=A0A182M1D2_9DIPT